jgi:hypothetical protein
MLNNGSSTSAGVYEKVVDNSVRGVAISPSVGAIVSASHRGPVGIPTLETSKKNFRMTFGAPDAGLTYGHFCAEQFLEEGDRLYFLRVARNALYGGIRLSSVNTFSMFQDVGQGYEDPLDYAFTESDILYLYSRDPGAWNNDIRVITYPDVNDRENEKFVLEIYEGSSTIASEVYRVTLRDKLDGYGRQMGIESVLESANSLLRCRVNRNNVSFRANEAVRLVNSVSAGNINHGSNGDPVTMDDIIEGWDLFEDREEITVTLLINAGYSSPAIQLRMVEIAEQRGDSIAILDTPSNVQRTQQAIQYRRNTLNVSSSFGALYLPDISITTEDNVTIWCPPSGYVAACYARTDRVAAEWFAPAGVTRGKIRANDVRHVYRQGDRDALDQNQINFIHKMPPYGLVVWSQETLQGFASALSNIHVRRLVNGLMGSLSAASLVGIYEPNDRFLQLALTNIADRILGPIKRGRGLYGYEVICDASNNTPELVASGDTRLDVYIDPMMTTKRIHLNAIVPRTGQMQYAISVINRD